MQKNPKDILIKILSIIGYEDNKSTYADEFIQNCEKQALLDLLTALPQEQQERFKQQIAGITDQKKQKAIIFTHTRPEQYTAALQKASATAFQGLIEELTPTLSTEQADNLKSYLQSLVSLNTPTRP